MIERLGEAPIESRRARATKSERKSYFLREFAAEFSLKKKDLFQLEQLYLLFD